MPKKLIKVLALLLSAAAVLAVVLNFDNIRREWLYPLEYSDYVEKYSDMYGVDRYLVYSVIKTESGFDSTAESGAGARGLMQLMEDAFDWVKYRMGDDRPLTYDDMYNAEYNIQYGTYMLKLLYEEYGSFEETLAAYHAGRGTVNGWLQNPDYSGDGKRLTEIPSRDTNHYVNKVMKAYDAYTNLY